MERGFGGEGVRDRAGWEVGGYIFRCFLVFFLCFFGVVFRASRDAFFGFRVPLGVSRGISRTSFLKNFENFLILGVALKAWQALCFSDISELRGTPEDEKR